MALNLDYFYGGEAEQYNFYRIPKALFTEERYIALSVESRVLYGLMLDRMSLSLKNNWLDDFKRVFIVFTLEDAISMLKFSHTKIVRLFKELDEIGLIERKKQGQGLPTLIYVKNFTSQEGGRTPHTAVSQDNVPKQKPKKRKVRVPDFRNPDFQKSEIQTSRIWKSRVPDSGSADFSNSDANYTERNNTESSDTDPSIHLRVPCSVGRNERRPSWQDKMDRMDRCREEIKANIDYDFLLQEHSVDMDLIDGYVELMVEACCTSKDFLIIGGEKLPSGLVKAQFFKLTQEHITYVLDCMKSNTTLIGNIKAYTLAALYNAPVTITQYYTSLVSHDLAHG